MKKLIPLLLALATAPALADVEKAPEQDKVAVKFEFESGSSPEVHTFIGLISPYQQMETKSAQCLQWDELLKTTQELETKARSGYSINFLPVRKVDGGLDSVLTFETTGGKDQVIADVAPGCSVVVGEATTQSLTAHTILKLGKSKAFKMPDGQLVIVTLKQLGEAK
ncbi:hypothetical protein HNP46_000451 [Pseudomonas nitritireducens]|uniref:Uncharacterized protein n=1 Tax=Pseudomonas nitroreducens TaxID=46680 RepID=A0A7W7KEZ7_PSENT|nr:hypothetical protein [Pseudomonas nitritireducens]MBB4861640.1 hypothetical protein [Pseudomonas nitritireducens]